MSEDIGTGEQSKGFTAGAATVIMATVASYAALKKGNISVAFLCYKSVGGFGLNFYRLQANGNRHRFFAIDYHRFKDPKTNQEIMALHYHRGSSLKELKLHRPYEGGW
ncbi:hypothetical protein [Legionella quinlivanii]|nr:hypothetical protein [Legionella quinlivanii]